MRDRRSFCEAYKYMYIHDTVYPTFVEYRTLYGSTVDRVPEQLHESLSILPKSLSVLGVCYRKLLPYEEGIRVCMYAVQ